MKITRVRNKKVNEGIFVVLTELALCDMPIDQLATIIRPMGFSKLEIFELAQEFGGDGWEKEDNYITDVVKAFSLSETL